MLVEWWFERFLFSTEHRKLFDLELQMLTLTFFTTIRYRCHHLPHEEAKRTHYRSIKGGGMWDWCRTVCR